MKNRGASLRHFTMLMLIGLLPFATTCRQSDDDTFIDQFYAKVQSEIRDEFGFSIHVLTNSLPAGTLLYPDVPGGTSDPAKSIRCGGECYLAMIDLMPGAHFGHPVVFAAYDLGDNELKGPVAADWWPWVPATGKRFFHTVEERRRTFVRCEPDCGTIYPDPKPDLVVSLSPMYSPPSDPPQACTVWAAIVNGYDDTADSFDEDTEGIYNVLRGMGVEDWCICYLSDDPSSAGKDAPARPANVEETLNYIANRTSGDPDSPATRPITDAGKVLCGTTPLGGVPPGNGPVDDFLLFISSHGSYVQGSGRPPELLCNHFKTDGGYIGSPLLATKLPAINTNRTTVVMEACYSGAFYDDLKNLAETSFFFSAGKFQKSFGDRDPPAYPDDNPGDTGSEAIWGFVEAFGTGAADGICNGTKDGMISFAEAVEYARDTDATPKISGQLRSIVQPPTPDPSKIPYLDRVNPVSLSPDLTLTAPNPALQTSNIGNTVTAKRCESNRFPFELTNDSDHRLAVGALRFHVVEPGDTGVNDWDHARTVMVAGIEAHTTTAVAFDWKVPKSFEKGTNIELVASIDSPQAPVAGDPGQTVLQAGIIGKPNSFFFPCGCRAD